MQGLTNMKIDRFRRGIEYMEYVNIYCGDNFQYLCKYGLYMLLIVDLSIEYLLDI